jgi:hypothetical protein
MIHHLQLATSNTSLVDAWSMSQSGPIETEYVKQSGLYGFPPLGCTPFWASWFARKVIVGRWPAAEQLIATDNTALALYNAHAQRCLDFDLLSDQDRAFEVAPNGQIIKWKNGQTPQKTTVPELDLDAISDRIQEHMNEQRKLKRMTFDVD